MQGEYCDPLPKVVGFGHTAVGRERQSDLIWDKLPVSDQPTHHCLLFPALFGVALHSSLLVITVVWPVLLRSGGFHAELWEPSPDRLCRCKSIYNAWEGWERLEFGFLLLHWLSHTGAGLPDLMQVSVFHNFIVFD